MTSPRQNLETIINHAYEHRQEFSPNNTPQNIRHAIAEIIEKLDRGEIRVAEKKNNHWVIHSWIKKTILLFLKIESSQIFEAGYTQFYDKIPLKYVNFTPETFNKMKVRVVPAAIVRKGAYIAESTVLMPSFINIGAYVD